MPFTNGRATSISRPKNPSAKFCNPKNMSVNSDIWAEVALVGVGVCWLAFGGILVVGKRQASGTEKQRDLKSHVGFALQGVAYALCYLLPRPYFSAFLLVSR